jgi:hypothetical protein
MSSKNSSNISRTYSARAVPARDGSGFLAYFAGPGGVSRPVMEGDKPKVYATAAVAEFYAMRTLLDALNKTPRRVHDGRRLFLSGDELAVQMAEADLTATQLSVITGSRVDRVISMLRGERTPPFLCGWLLPEIAADPALGDRVYQRALDLTDKDPEEANAAAADAEQSEV